MLFKKRIKPSIQKADTFFEIITQKETYKIEWSEITKITVYKENFITIDEIRMEIEYKNEFFTLTEEIENWQEFKKDLNLKLNLLDKNWESNIVQPPFKRNETIIFNNLKQ